MIVGFRDAWLRDFFVFRWNADRGEASDLYLDNHSYR